RARRDLLHHARHEHRGLRPVFRGPRRSGGGRLADHGPRRRPAAVDPPMKRLAGFCLIPIALWGQGTTVRVDITNSINSFDPDSALGSSIDVLSRTGIDKVFTPHIIQEALSAGWGPITYRNNSELRMAAWHWTENGTWSDAANRRGYFTSSSELKEPLRYILS